MSTSRASRGDGIIRHVGKAEGYSGGGNSVRRVYIPLWPKGFNGKQKANVLEYRDLRKDKSI